MLGFLNIHLIYQTYFYENKFTSIYEIRHFSTNIFFLSTFSFFKIKRGCPLTLRSHSSFLNSFEFKSLMIYRDAVEICSRNSSTLCSNVSCTYSFCSSCFVATLYKVSAVQSPSTFPIIG